ncbi:MAG: DNA-binding protein [Deltaproteobacteria bacterium]|nr:MAG: DNA-binding protein [Deltaproteobacteria bacterium]
MPENKTQDQLLTPEEAAARLKISRLTLGNWLRSGKLKGVKVGRLWRVPESGLEKFLHAPPSYEFKDGYPVIPCKKVGSELIFLKPCPYCGERHTHGAAGGGGHRAAHCPDEIRQGQKYIKVPTEAQRGYYLEVVE